MINKFNYEERATCICGQPLSSAAGHVHKIFPWGDLHFLRCEYCGSWCQSPQISIESLTEWFNSVDYYGSNTHRGVAYANYMADENNRLREAAARYERDIQHELPKRARVLEIGCATGSLLSVLHAAGHEVRGLDLSSVFADAALEYHGISVEVGDALSADLPLEYFDAVLLFGTIGNLQDFSKYLFRIRQVLKPGGILIINFPDANSGIVKYIYRSQFWMFTPSANFFPTSMGCTEALNQSGFYIQSLTRDRQNTSFRKLLSHAKLGMFIPLFSMFGIDSVSLPFSIPLPGIRLLKARLHKPERADGGS